MLQDIPYNVLKEDPREYAILLRRDQTALPGKRSRGNLGFHPPGWRRSTAK